MVVDIACLIGDDLKQIGTTVPTTQTGESPVGTDGGNGRVMSVEGVVCGALQVLGNRSTDEDREDPVSIFMDVAI